jgi:hypothetical protein
MNVRVAKNAAITSILMEASVPYEPEVFNPDTTLVFKFPVIQGPARPAEQVSLWEQANLLCLMQREWADNSVSNTLYFKPKWKLTRHLTTQEDVSLNLKKYKFRVNQEQLTQLESGELRKLEQIEEDKIKCVLFHEKWPTNNQSKVQLKIYNFEPNHEENIIEIVLASIAPLIKSCSLLPHTAKGVYRQMPQEGITEKEYKRLIKKIKPIDWSKLTGVDANNDEDKYCSGGVCSVPGM